jgi:succinate dehydrogenase (ubiquinone) iron-sulfur subunit
MQAYRWVIDSRDEYTDERLEKIGGDMRLNECYQIGICSLTCPKGLDPRGAIENLKAMYKEYATRKASDVTSF